VHDAISIERLGVPTACVVTDGFVPTARVMAEFAGMPGYPLVVIAHPISDNTGAQLRAKAEQIVYQSVRVLLSRAADTPITDGLETIREVLRADSADVELLSYEDGTAHLRLILGHGCDECVMPRSVLEPMLLRHLQHSRPDIRRVILEDPRASR
jgi:Fe-S cluster biogenesis protein NfuA